MSPSPFELLVTCESPEFTNQEAARLTGTTVARLLGGVNRDLTPLVNHTRHKRRKFTTHNLSIIKLAIKLSNLQISTHYAISAAGQIWIDILDFLRTPPATGERRFSDIVDAIAIIRAGEPGAPLNVLVVYNPQDIPTRDLIDGNPSIIFSCGKVLSELAFDLHEYVSTEKLASN